MKFILGKKIGMSQVFKESGDLIPVTVVKAGPCFITQIKTKEKDGYFAVQVGFEKKEKKIKKTEKGKEYKYLKEFRLDENEIKNYEKGKEIDVSIFEEGDKVKVSGTSKAKGFQGVVKRWNFRGAPKTHGTKHTLRKPGSIGSTDPARVFKGKKMAGRTGGNRITISNLEIVGVDKENGYLLIKGAVPGRKNSLLEIRKN